MFGLLLTRVPKCILKYMSVSEQLPFIPMGKSNALHLFNLFIRSSMGAKPALPLVQRELSPFPSQINSEGEGQQYIFKTLQ